MQIEALVANAHRRLALRRLLIAIERNPQLLEGEISMSDKPRLKIKLPMELAGLKHRMIRAEKQEQAIGRIGERYDDAQNGIDELIDAHAEHVGALEQYHHELRRKIEGMVASNGGPTDEDGQTGRSSDDQGDKVGQIITGKPEA